MSRRELAYRIVETVVEQLESEHPEEPYLEKYGELGPISIWIVDGEYVRNHIGIEFTNFGTGLAYEFIPADEFWLDDEADDDEYPFFVTNMETQYRAMQNGTSYDKALEVGDRRERAMREKCLHFPVGTGDGTEAHIALLAEVET